MMFDVASIHPFPLNGPGGGSRILRALMQTEHPPVLFIDTDVSSSSEGHIEDQQIRVPFRRHFGRLESTRFSALATVWDPLFTESFQGRLEAVLWKHGVRVAHLIPHHYGFAATWRTCRKLGLPVVLTIHDDLDYAIARHPHKTSVLRSLGDAWRNSEARLSISDELAIEYNRRFGERSYSLVTDGVNDVKSRAQQFGAERKITVYFMGLFHYNYSENFRVLIDVLEKLQQTHPEIQVELRCRCGAIPFDTSQVTISVVVLPFDTEAVVERDLDAATLVYQPLSFDAQAQALGRFSLSTKMITYLGSGLPILFHGPNETAACQLLTKAGAAAVCTSLRAADLATALEEALQKRDYILANAKALVEQKFLLTDQQHRFWSAIGSNIP